MRSVRRFWRVFRPPIELCRYTTIKHEADGSNPLNAKRFVLLLYVHAYLLCILSVFSERELVFMFAELMFMFAICRRPSVRLSSVCRL